MRRLGRWFVAGLVLAIAKVAPRPRRALPPGEPIVEQAPPARGPELAVAALLALAALFAAGFVVVYAVETFEANTQLLGLALGLAFAFLSAALILTAKRVLPHEEEAEPYARPGEEHAHEQLEIEQIADESARAFSRRRLLVITAAGAGTAVGAALLTPLASLGPFLDVGRLRHAPWRRGVRLVDASGEPLDALALDYRAMVTAFPEGADPEDVGSPIVVVRLRLDQLNLPQGRADWAPNGIVAYSKICTHAGCAVSLYRTPLFDPTEPKPALVCPCHYSAFDPATGGTVTFGPAGRPLPQLPLEIADDGALMAAGGLSGPPGPSWRGVRT